MSRPGIKPRPPQKVAGTLAKGYSNSVFIAILNMYIWAHDNAVYIAVILAFILSKLGTHYWQYSLLLVGIKNQYLWWFAHLDVIYSWLSKEYKKNNVLGFRTWKFLLFKLQLMLYVNTVLWHQKVLFVAQNLLKLSLYPKFCKVVKTLQGEHDRSCLCYTSPLA